MCPLMPPQVEDRPVVKERVTRMREHHPVEKEFVVSGWGWMSCRLPPWLPACIAACLTSGLHPTCLSSCLP